MWLEEITIVGRKKESEKEIVKYTERQNNQSTSCINQTSTLWVEAKLGHFRR